MRKHYSTLAELIQAYHDHELTPETAVVELDKNEVSVTWHAADDEDWLRAETVFEGYQADLLTQALDLLGIPWECGNLPSIAQERKVMRGYRKMHAAKVKAAQRKLHRKRARWGDKVIIRGSGKGGGNNCSASQRRSMTASALRRRYG